MNYDSVLTRPIQEPDQPKFKTFDEWGAEAPINPEEDKLARYHGYQDYLSVEMAKANRFDPDALAHVGARLAGRAYRDGALDLSDLPEDTDEETLSRTVMERFDQRPQDPFGDIDAVVNWAFRESQPGYRGARVAEDGSVIDPFQGGTEPPEYYERVQEVGRRLAILRDPKSRGEYLNPADYENALQAAEDEFGELVGPDKIDMAKSRALAEGVLPVAVFTDSEGNRRVETSPDMDRYTDDPAGIAAVFEANPHLDKRLLGPTLAKLTTLPGYETTLARMERSGDLQTAIDSVIRLEGGVRGTFRKGYFNQQVGHNSVRNAFQTLVDRIERGLDPNVTPESVKNLLTGTALAKEYSEEELFDAFTDYAKRAARPDSDSEDPMKAVVKLSTGEWHVPTSVLLDRAAFDKVVSADSPIPERQKAVLRGTREARLEEESGEILRAFTHHNPKFTAFYDRRLSEGASKVQVMEEWRAMPENHNAVEDYTKGITWSFFEGIASIPLMQAAMRWDDGEGVTGAIGNWSKDVLSKWREDDRMKREYASVFGTNLNWRYDAAVLFGPVVADLAVSRGIATAATSAARAAARAAPRTLRATTRSFLEKTISSDSRTLAKRFIESSAARGSQGAKGLTSEGVIQAMGRDMTGAVFKGSGYAAVAATSYNRSAGMTYISLHNLLSAETNADGTPKYTPEQVREISLTHANVAGMWTVATVWGFMGLGIGGLEKLAISRGMTRRQLAGVHARLRKDMAKADPAVFKGVDMTTPMTMLDTMAKRGVGRLRELAGAAGQEGVQEALDEFGQYFNEAVATGDLINIRDAVRQAGYAGLLGSIMGGSVTLAARATSRLTTPATPDVYEENAVRRNYLLEIARNLENSNAPETAKIVRAMTAENRAAAAGAVRSMAEMGGVFPTTPDNATRTTAQPDPAAAAQPDPAAAAQPGLPGAQEDVPASDGGTGGVEASGQPDVASPAEVSVTPEQAVQELESSLGDLTPSVAKKARAMILENAEMIAQLRSQGVKIGIFKTKSEFEASVGKTPSGNKTAKGTSYKMPDGTLGIAFYAKAFSSKAQFEQTLGHEASHIAQYRFETTSEGQEALAASRGMFDPANTALYDAKLDEFMRKEYPKWDSLGEDSKVREAGRAIMEGQAKGQTSGFKPGIFSYLKRFLDYVNRTIPDGSPLAKYVQGATAELASIQQKPASRNAASPNGVNGAKPSTPPSQLAEVAVEQSAPADETPEARFQQADSSAAPNPTVEEILEPEPQTDEEKRVYTVNRVRKSDNPELALKDDPVARQAVVDTLVKMGLPAEITNLSNGDLISLLGRGPERANQTAEVTKELGDSVYNTAEFLGNLAKGKGPLAKFAKLLSGFPEFIEETKITLIENPMADWSGVHIPGVGVIINTAVRGPRGAIDTLIHEYTHAATQTAVRLARAGMSTPASRRLLQRIDRHRMAISRRARAQDRYTRDMQYALSNIDEFIAHWFTDAGFQAQVEALTPDGERSWAQVFAENIANLLDKSRRGKTQGQLITAELMLDMTSFTRRALEGDDEFGLSRRQQLLGMGEAQFQPADSRASGVNVRSDTKAGRKYADLIVDGEKTYETRDTNSLKSMVGKTVSIVRTGEGTAKAIGAVTFGEPIEVGEAQFRQLEDQHMVPRGSAFDIKPGATKFLYPLTDAVRYPLELDVGVGSYKVRPVIGVENLSDARFQRASDAEYLSLAKDPEKNREALQRMVDAAARASGLPIILEEGVTAYRVRRSAPPKKTVTAYKLFRVKKSQKGEVFALFVGANDPLPQDVWLDAIAGPRAEDSKTGKAKVKSKLGPLAYRPGWHAGDVPLATHIGAQEYKGGPIIGRKEDEVWAEVEMAADVDYQPEANANGRTKDGEFSVALADIKRMPENGLYRYKTNPNMTGQWIISGSMRINRILSESEVNAVLQDAQMTPMPWTEKPKGAKSPTVAPLDLSRWGLGTNPARNQKKLLDPVTYDADGNVIPLSQRFDAASPDIRFQKVDDFSTPEFDEEINKYITGNWPADAEGRYKELQSFAEQWAARYGDLADRVEFTDPGGRARARAEIEPSGSVIVRIAPELLESVSRKTDEVLAKRQTAFILTEEFFHAAELRALKDVVGEQTNYLPPMREVLKGVYEDMERAAAKNPRVAAIMASGTAAYKDLTFNENDFATAEPDDALMLFEGDFTGVVSELTRQVFQLQRIGATSDIEGRDSTNEWVSNAMRLVNEAAQGEVSFGEMFLQNLDRSKSQLDQRGIRFQLASAPSDAEYLSAVERGDMETAQRMVDSFVRKQVETALPLWERLGSLLPKLDPYNTRETSYPSLDTDPEIFFSGSSPQASELARAASMTSGEKLVFNKAAVAIRKVQPSSVIKRMARSVGDEKSSIFKRAKSYQSMPPQELTEEAVEDLIEEAGFNEFLGNQTGALADANAEAERLIQALHRLGQPTFTKSYLWPDTDPVTYDAQGNVIPLSRRFDAASPDIRFQRDTARFVELTRDLYADRDSATAQEIEAWKAANPDKWQELSEMRETVLKEAGWDVGPVYHGTSEGNSFTVFRQSDDPERTNIGFHFGSKEQAEFRVRGDSDSDAGEFFRVYLKGSFVKIDDLGSFDPDVVATWMEKDKRWVDSAFTEEVTSRLEEVARGQDIQNIFNELIYPEFLSRGYTGVVYENNIEGPGESYAVFDPSQIKSADPLSPGPMVTPDQWGNAESPDIRFQRAGDSEAPSDPFYSQLERVIAAKVPNRATPQQIMATIDPTRGSGVKAEEIKWTGIETWMQGKDKVDKAELLQWLRDEGAVRFEEVTSGVVPDSMDIDDVTLQMFGVDYQTATEDQRRQAEQRITRNETKFSQYTLPGGENYREVVLAMPGQPTTIPGLTAAETREYLGIKADPDPGMADEGRFQELEAKITGPAPTQQTYTSSHFPDVPNYVSHMRLNERTDADGNPGLFIEELQSDRHQQARKEGYAIPAGTRPTPEQAKEFFGITDDSWKTMPEEQKQSYVDEIMEGGKHLKGGIPDAPFRTTWPLAMFKRALRDAVASGKQWIGWTVGETQIDRFDLSKQVHRVLWEPRAEGRGNLRVLGKESDTLLDQEMAADKVEDYIGKEAAARLFARPVEKSKFFPDTQTLDGDGLKVGGSGMKGFYDNMLPKEIGKYVKQWGAKVEKGEVVVEKPRQGVGADPTIGEITDFAGISVEEYLNLQPDEQQRLNREAQASFSPPTEVTPIWRVNITPEMRQSVAGGQAAFQFAGERARLPQFMADSLETAKAMAASGKPSKEIRAVTGWFPGPYDGKMRWEIPDNGVKFTSPQVFYEVAEAFSKGETGEQFVGSLDSIINHPDLFEAYPQLRNVEVTMMRSLGGGRVAVFRSGNSIVPPAIMLAYDGDPGKVKSYVLHEIQHAIQDIEGFALGGNEGTAINTLVRQQRQAEIDRMQNTIDSWRSRAEQLEGDDQNALFLNSIDLEQRRDRAIRAINEPMTVTERRQFTGQKGFQAYLNVAGEIEARDVQARANLTPEQLKAIEPYSSENIAPEDAIVMFQRAGDDAKPSLFQIAFDQFPGDRAAVDAALRDLEADDFDDAAPDIAADVVRSAVARELAHAAGAEAAKGVDPEQLRRTLDHVGSHPTVSAVPSADDMRYYGDQEALDGLVTYLDAARGKLETILSERFDSRTAILADRLGRHAARARRGFRVENTTLPFDPENPAETENLLRFQKVDDSSTPEFDEEINKYITGNWPADAVSRAQELSSFSQQWAARYGDLADRVEFPATNGDAGFRASVEKDGAVVVRIPRDLLGQIAGQPGEFAAKREVAAILTEEFFHAATFKALQDITGKENPSAPFELMGRVYENVFDSMRKDREAASAISASMAVYRERYGPTSFFEEAKPDDALLFMEGRKDLLVGELSRQIFQLTRMGTTSEIVRSKEQKALVEKLMERLNTFVSGRRSFGDEMAELVDASTKQLDQRGIRFQKVDDSSSAPVQFTHYTSLHHGDPEAQAGADSKAGWFTRMFARTDDMRTPWSKVRRNRKGESQAIEAQHARLNNRFKAVIAKSNAGVELLDAALGSTAPLLTPKVETEINEMLDSAKELATDTRERLTKEARVQMTEDLKVENERHAAEVTALTDQKDVKRAEREHKAEVREIRDRYDESLADAETEYDRILYGASELAARQRIESEVGEANRLRQERDNALAELERVNPDLHDWAVRMRTTINELQRKVRDLYGDRPYLSAKIDRSLGVYLVRSYRIHQDPSLARKILKNPEYAELRERATAFFAEKLQAQEEENIRRQFPEMDPAAVTQQARATADELAVGAFEDFILGHEAMTSSLGTSAASNDIRTEVVRFMRKQNIPPILREALQENTDPVFNAERTAASLANILSVQQSVRTIQEEGVKAGWLVSKSEFLNGIPKYRGLGDAESAKRLLEDPAFAEAREIILKEARDALETPIREDLYRTLGDDRGGLSQAEFDKKAGQITEARAQEYLEGLASGRYRPVQEIPGSGVTPERLVQALQNHEDPAIRSMFAIERDRATARKWVPLISTKGASSPYAPLAGWYASPEDAEAFSAAFFPNKGVPQSSAGKMFAYTNRLALSAAGMSLGIVTLGNPAYYFRNVVGNTTIMLAQGVNPFSAESRRAYANTIRGAFDKDGDFNADIDELIALRVLKDGAKIEYLRDLLSRWAENPLGLMDSVNDALSEANQRAGDILAAGRKMSKQGLAALGKLAEVTETYPSVAIYYYMKSLLQEANFGTPQEIRQEAARRTKMVTPSKSEASQAVDAFTKSGWGALLAPFIRFKADMWRTTINTYILALADIRSENPVLRASGKRRMASAATVHILVTAALGEIFKMIMGIGDDEDRAIRSGLPVYNKDASLVYVPDKENGTVTISNLTFLNPFSFVFNPFVASIRNLRTGDYEESVAVWARYVGEEFFGENIAVGRALDVKRNLDDSTGRAVYQPTDSLFEKSRKSLAHIFDGAYNPALFKQIDRFADAVRSDAPKDSFWFTPMGILAGTVVPFKPRAYTVADLEYRSFSNLRRTNGDLWMHTAPLLARSPVSDRKVASLYESRVEAQRKVWDDVRRNMAGFEALGRSRREVASQAVEAGLSRKRVNLALRGLTERPVFSPESLLKVRKLDAQRYNAYMDSVRKYPGLITLD